MPTEPMAKTRLQIESKEQDAALVVPMMKHDDGPLRFRVVQNPGQSFYKDEGGKANHMVTVVCLESAIGSKSVPVGGKLLVTPRLCYENGKDVEDAAEIFKVLSMEPKAVTTTEQKITVKFRIEKVSRRKDGQRFKVRFDADPSQLGREVKPAFTSPVCVLSKRKFPSNASSPTQKNAMIAAHQQVQIASTPGNNTHLQKKGCGANFNKRPKSNSVSSPSPANGMRRGSVPVTKAEFVAEDVSLLKTTVSLLESKVEKLIERIGVLEGESSYLRESLKRSRQELQENMRTSNLNIASQGITPFPIIQHEVIKLDYGDADVLSDLEMLTDDTRPLKRTTSANMAFDFGLPNTIDPDDF